MKPTTRRDRKEISRDNLLAPSRIEDRKFVPILLSLECHGSQPDQPVLTGSVDCIRRRTLPCRCDSRRIATLPTVKRSTTKNVWHILQAALQQWVSRAGAFNCRVGAPSCRQ